jgi:hypothetical protein
MNFKIYNILEQIGRPCAKFNYLKMNLLDAWAVCFLKGKPPEFARFFNEINIFAILCQLHYLLVEHKRVFRSNWVHFGFSYVLVIWMPWLGYPNKLTDFWRPGDCRNRTCTCFFQIQRHGIIGHLYVAASLYGMGHCGAGIITRILRNFAMYRASHRVGYCYFQALQWCGFVHTFDMQPKSLWKARCIVFKFDWFIKPMAITQIITCSVMF